jgi:uncharacterized coiled-coil protein SlyX
MKLKHCPHCNLDLPREAFTSTRAKYCINCKRIRQLEQQKAMQKRAFEKMKVKKQKKKTVLRTSDLKKKVQRVFNKYIRLRDKYKPCISCGVTSCKTWHAGHFWAMGSNGALRYHEDNCHKQCASCNTFKSGNLLEYRLGLIRRIGIDRVNALDEMRHATHKFTREELENLLTTYQQKIKEL